MRHRRLPLLVRVLALALIATTPAAALDLPARKPGLWELKMVFEGRNLPPQMTQECVDAATDQEMFEFRVSPPDMCEGLAVTNVNSAIVADSVCLGGELRTRAATTGDFSSAYVVKLTVRSARPSPETADINSIIAAKWIGTCAADQRPGDITMSNGMKMNIRDWRKNLPGTPSGGPSGPSRPQLEK
jgi:hypothetical protein